MATTLCVLNLGYGNVQSIRYAFARIHCSTEVISTPEALMQAERIVIPGVGAANTAIEALHRLDLWEPLLAFQRPLLGICLGMQLMAQQLDEGDQEGLPNSQPSNTNTHNNLPSTNNSKPSACSGLGVFQGRIQALNPRSGILPHMGWNALTPVLKEAPVLPKSQALPESQKLLELPSLPKSLKRLTKGFAQKPHYSYFAHSYALYDQRHALCLTEYEDRPFVSVAFKEPYMGIQAHPERSGAVGEALLTAFLGV